MAEAFDKAMDGVEPVRGYPRMQTREEGAMDAVLPPGGSVQALLGMRTPEAAEAVFLTSFEALGAAAEGKADMVAAMFAELEPRDAIEAMLVAQMTATHVAMTAMAGKLSKHTMHQTRESCERSMTRLGRVYVTQMDALKKYRRKAQQVVRVERVTVHEGGQAIVGDVRHGAGD